MRFIIPELPKLEREEDIFTLKWIAECLSWYCRIGYYVGDEYE